MDPDHLREAALRTRDRRVPLPHPGRRTGLVEDVEGHDRAALAERAHRDEELRGALGVPVGGLRVVVGLVPDAPLSDAERAVALDELADVRAVLLDRGQAALVAPQVRVGDVHEDLDLGGPRGADERVGAGEVRGLGRSVPADEVSGLLELERLVGRRTEHRRVLISDAHRDVGLRSGRPSEPGQGDEAEGEQGQAASNAMSHCPLNPGAPRKVAAPRVNERGLTPPIHADPARRPRRRGRRRAPGR